MSYLTVPGDFEREIQRGILSHRSGRLTVLLQAIDDYIRTQRRSRLMAVHDGLLAWHATDPKEYADRAAVAGPRLASEVSALLENWGRGEIRVVDPSAHPVYSPGLWNSPDIRLSTNCYAYACNDPAGHPRYGKPQPGELAGVGIARVEESAVRFAVMADDQRRAQVRIHRLIPLVRLRGEAVPGCVSNVAGHYLVALFVSPTLDYHWVRQDRDGMWSHKPGHGFATNLDSSLHPIADPRDCDMRLVFDNDEGTATFSAVYEFTTFYYVPRGGVRTGDLGHLRR